ncbi:MAG: ParB/RepB/Spo0J family partition protein [Nitrososphaerota archaeon]
MTFVKNPEIKEIPIELILLDDKQPRENFDQEKIKELADSIEEHGLIHRIVVRPLPDGKYKVIAGERRLRACKLLGWKTIPADVRNMDDKEASLIQLIENIQREGLSPIEEAKALHRLVEEHGLTHEEIAQKIGKSRSYVTNSIRLLKLSEPIKSAINEGKLTQGHARLLINLSPDEQNQVFQQIVHRNLSVRETESLLSKVSHETSSDEISKNDLFVSVWLGREVFSKLKVLAESNRMSIEKYCSKILTEVVQNGS